MWICSLFILIDLNLNLILVFLIEFKYGYGMDLGQSQPICSLVSQDPAGWVGVSRGRGWRRKGKSRKGRAHQRGAFHGPIPMRFRKRASRCSFLARSPLDQKRKKRRLESSFSYALMLPSFPPLPSSPLILLHPARSVQIDPLGLFWSFLNGLE